MDGLKQFALEDELDDQIELAAEAIDDGIYSSGGDLSEVPQEEDGVDYDDEADVFEEEGPLYTSTFPERPARVTYHTYKNVFGGGSTTYGSDGSTYQTIEHVFLDGTTTYGSDGKTYQTMKSVFSEGTTTYGSNGTTYQTEKKLFDDGTVTYGSDGSKFETTPDLFGGGSTTQKI